MSKTGKVYRECSECFRDRQRTGQALEPHVNSCECKCHGASE